MYKSLQYTIVAYPPLFLHEKFETRSEDQKENFLSICTRSKGVKMLYDCYFKEILNPEYTPERLSALLSIIIRKKVTVKYQLPNDNTRIGDELSLVITDIVVELEDGTLANIEVQKLGYAFTGERASCYSADLLLRQYKRVAEVLCKLKLARIGAQRVASNSLFFPIQLHKAGSYDPASHHFR